jgi:Tol biopolymer transport system component
LIAIARSLVWAGVLVALALWVSPGSTQAQQATEAPVSSLCPAPVELATGLAPGTPDGLILTAFDASGIWVYDVSRNGRYPLSDTTPCAGACRLSPDGTELLYLYNGTNAFNRMRLDGAVRSMVVEYAGQVEWWDSGHFLVYTPGHTIYLLDAESGNRELLPPTGVISVQPGGRFALVVSDSTGQPVRALRDLSDDTGAPLGELPLAPDRMYQNAASWSPDGKWLAFVAPVGASSSELFGIQPGQLAAERWTNLTSDAGAIRINGQATGELSWSPDSDKIAFWVTPLNGDPLDAPGQPAVLHILDLASGKVTRLCGYTTPNTTPNPPRLVWSPDSAFIAFADDSPGQPKGTLLVVDATSGEFRALTSGVAAVNGPPALIAWGVKP